MVIYENINDRKAVNIELTVNIWSFCFIKSKIPYKLHATKAGIVSKKNIFEGKILGSGASHYLEHLVAGGTTKTRSEQDYRQLINSFGGAYNAYTTYDHTAYYIHSAANHIPHVIQVLAEWVTTTDWTTKEFNRERGVVLKEMDRANNNSSRAIYQTVQSNYYKDSKRNIKPS